MSDAQNSDAQEKSHDASESKIKKSRKKGDVPQSTELNILFLYSGLIVCLLLFSKALSSTTLQNLSVMMVYPAEMGEAVLGGKSGDLTRPVLKLFWRPVLQTLPVLLVLIAFIGVSLTVQRAVVFAPDKIKPKLSRLSPISNAKQKYGPQGIVEFLKRAFKLSFISAVAIGFFIRLIPELPARSAMTAGQALLDMNQVFIELSLLMTAALSVIVLFDWPYSYFSHLKKLRMSRKELEDENKESEGDPYQKSLRRNRALEISQSSMIRDVATADVVIVNPTHYAVALRWEREKKTVPIVVAKGVDNIARQIRDQAKKYDLPIHSNPPCARSLYTLVEVGSAIRPEHYAAVAASIRYADSLKPRSY